MGLKDVLEVAWELHELLCDIPLEIEDPEERDAGAETFIKRSISPGQCRMQDAGTLADALVKLVRNQQ